MKNQNHPKKGSFIKVEPIRRIKDINTIKTLLHNKPRDYCLFVMGINTNLRASDLLKIKVNNVKNLRANDELIINEQKTKKYRHINLNKACIDAIRRLLNSRRYNNDDFLFMSQKKCALQVPSVTRLVKNWCKAVNLKGNYGSHTLRKTWGYHQRVTFNVAIPELMVCFNHSSQRQTLDYLCVQPEEIKKVYQNTL